MPQHANGLTNSSLLGGRFIQGNNPQVITYTVNHFETGDILLYTSDV